jgi:predicted Zn-dependent peptidase
MTQHTLSAQQSIQFSEYDLSNGLHVILHRDTTTPVVVISVMYHVGSKNETDDRTGFAHFFEHLLFEGTENINRGDYIKTVQRLGGTVNANTSNDRTFYYEVFPSNRLETGLWMESERMLHAKVDHKGIETQRKVVKEERRQRYDNQPYGTLVEESMKRAFTDHPYRWTTIGSMEHLDAAGDADYKQFYDTYYVPDNAVLTIAGDFDPATCKAWVEKYFGTIPRGTAPRNIPPPYDKPLVHEIRDTVYDDVQLPAVIQLYRIPAYGSKEFYTIKLLSDILSSGASSRLSTKLVDEKEIAAYVGSFPFQLEHPGVYLQFAIATIGVSADSLENEMNGIVEQLREELITQEEYDKLQNITEYEMLDRRTKLLNIAEDLATNYTYLNNTAHVNEEINIYKSISRADIREAARNYLSKSNRVTLYWLPKNQAVHQ